MNSKNKDKLGLPNIYLIGLMGTGKSTIGKKLASQLKISFIDSDQQIEEKSGMSISEIFTKYGENYFRKLEKDFIISGHPEENCVVACGGGLCVPQGAIEKLKGRGKVICLWASIRTLFDRTKMDHSRPLLQVSNPLKALEDLLSERESRYREADLIIETDGITPDEVVLKVLKELNRAAN